MTNNISGAEEYFLRSVQINIYSVTLIFVSPSGEDIRLTVFSEDVRESEGALIDEYRFAELVQCAENYVAYKKAIDLLAYGDMSKKKTVMKLRQRGYSTDSAINAAALLEKKGFIKEAEHAMRCAETEVRKKYGPSRISARLFSLGFEPKYIREAMEYIEENTDFAEILSDYAASHRLEEKLIANDYSTRQKAIASLVRRGFSHSQISELIKNLK